MRNLLLATVLSLGALAARPSVAEPVRVIISPGVTTVQYYEPDWREREEWRRRRFEERRRHEQWERERAYREGYGYGRPPPPPPGPYGYAPRPW